MIDTYVEQSLSDRQPRDERRRPSLKTTIAGVGTATPSTSYSQADLLQIFAVQDRRVRSLFLNSHIDRRHLTLPSPDANGLLPKESQAELLKKHRASAVDLGASAVQSCLRSANATAADIAFLCCVTTTGFLSPGVSAYLCRALDLSPACARLDVVGMGCNGGLNALNATASWAKANLGKFAIMLCVEICSAGYVIDETARTAVVNSLFGDGAAAVALLASDEDSAPPGPAILKFHGRIITEAIDAMRYDWDESHGKFSFFLDPQIPYVVGANIERTIDGLLSPWPLLMRTESNDPYVDSGGR